MQPEKTIQLGEVEPLSLSLDYQADPLCVLNTLRTSSTEHLLLESAEVDSKANLKSILMVDAALRIHCMGQHINIDALSASGEVLLPYLAATLGEAFAVTKVAANSYHIQCPVAAHDLTEDERLRAPSNLSPLRVLQNLQATREHPFAVFLGGIFGYDLIASFEDLPEVPGGHNNCPDYVFYLAETLVVMDHQARRTELIGCLIGGDELEQRASRLYQRMGELSAQLQRPKQVIAEPADTALEVTATPDAATFARHVEELKESIYAGDIFQVVPSRQFSLPCNHALAAYQQLKIDNPSPYMFYLKTTEFEVFGASPESALKYDSESNQVELYPIAGTRIRGKDEHGKVRADLDSRIELELRRDQKELAEHMMLVDLARNDLARIAVTGSRYVADLLQVDRYSHVMHLVSRVVAQLRPELDALDAYRACMNMGTLTGAPKISASRLIRQVEQERRGSYGGAVGYLTGDGDMDTCIVIRSALVRNGIAVVQAGAGVVFDSQAEAEVAETENKAKAVINAIIKAQQPPSVEVTHG
ncbi:MAG: anthranilate synthase component 1 [Idiomarina sp.]|nr:anthranilate synthase component 1 [Idiomarina sp.]